MCFDMFLLAFESHDLSQADKSINRVFSFPNWVVSSKSYFSVSQAFIKKQILSILSDLPLTRKN